MFQWREWRFLIIGEAFLTHKKIFYLLNVCKSLNLSKKNGTPGGIRTHDLLLRRQTLYPAELRVQPLFIL